MDLISLGLAVFRFLNLIMKQVDEEKFRADGRRQQYIEERRKFDERTGIGRQIEEDVANANVEDLRRELTE